MTRDFIKLRVIAYCGIDCNRIVYGNDCDLPAMVYVNTSAIESIEEYNHTLEDSEVDFEVHSMLTLRCGVHYYVKESVDEVYKLIVD